MSDPAANLVPLDAILDQLQRVLTRPGAEGAAQVQPLFKQSLVFLAGLEEGSPAHSRASRRLVFLARLALLENQDAALVKLCLGFMVAEGHTGATLAAAFLSLGAMPLDQLKGVVDAMPAAERLALFDRFFARNRGADPKLLAWAFQTVADIQGEDPEEALVFLEGLAKRGETVSHPVQRELMRSRFGIWLLQLFKLELSDEQVRYMATTGGALDTPVVAEHLVRLLGRAPATDLPALLAVVGGRGDKGNQRLVKAAAVFVGHTGAQVKLAALNALADLAAPQAPVLLAEQYARHEALRGPLLALVLRLDGGGFGRFLKVLPEPLQAGALAALARLVTDQDQDWVLATLDGPVFKRAAAGPLKALRGDLLGRKALKRQAFFTPKPRSYRQEKQAEDAGVLESVMGLFGGKREPVRPEEGEGLAKLRAAATGGRLEKAMVAKGSAPGLALREVRFTDCSFSGLDLEGLQAQKADFLRCSFKRVDMAACRLSGVRFTDCDLADVRLAEGSLTNVRFSGCRLRGLDLQAATAKGLAAEATAFEACDFWGARLEDMTLSAVRFTASGFSHATLASGTGLGVEFLDCHFDRTLFSHMRLAGLTEAGTRYSGCRFAATGGDGAGLLAAQTETRRVEYAGLARRLKAEDFVPVAGTAPLLRALLGRWCFEASARRRLGAFLAANARRRDWALDKWSGPTADFVRALPGLIEAPAVRRGEGFEAAPATSIAGYRPDLTAREALEGLMAGTDAAVSTSTAGKTTKPLPVEGLYSIGSVGTVAQNRGSDLDLWLVIDQAAYDAVALARLKDKLAAIEAWAQAACGLELHFFVMDAVAVRANDFGASDAESAGSTQAQLLKEEFYRTCVVLAGRRPAWWYLRASERAEDYAKGLKALAASHTVDAARFIDLGHLGGVSRAEFFGAALWQIVKALKSPFKSVMKLAVLDKYMSSPDLEVLLCNRVSDSLALGRRDLWRVDPYAVLFREVYEHYRGGADKEARKLMRMAFLQKTGYARSGRAEGRTTGRAWDQSGVSWMEFHYPFSDLEIEGDLAPRVEDPGDTTAESFRERVELGAKVGAFMFRTYQRIQERVRAERQNGVAAGAAVTDRDLTMLGRKVFAAFDRGKAGKTPRIPFMNRPAGMFQALDLACEGKPGAPMTWVMRGEPARREGKGRKLETIVEDKAPVRLFAWLIANNLFMPSLHVQGSAIQAPVSIPDVRELLEALHGFFPHKETFDRDILENLQPERALKAFVVVNFTAMREDKRIMDVALVHATNHGELFCNVGPAEPRLLETDPWRFLKVNIAAPLAEGLPVEVFAPRRSLAPKVSF